MNLRSYDNAWVQLNRDLNCIATSWVGLGGALRALRDHQLALGFIRDDLDQMYRHRFEHPERPGHFFTVQYNPARAQRFGGSGIKVPPHGANLVNNGCFLCPENIKWQQRGRELGYELSIDDHHFIAWMNPYPLLAGHTVIASIDHVPQRWKANGDASASKHLDHVVGHLVGIAARLPGWIGFYNGVGAGASIPHHFHYQFLPRPGEIARFPLQLAAQRHAAPGPVYRDCYPLTFAHWQGPADQVLQQALPWLRAYLGSHKAAELTANLVATRPDGSELLELYFIPRDAARARSPEMSGLIGGLEVLGELIFSSEDERLRLERSEVDYATVARILGSVAVGIEPTSD